MFRRSLTVGLKPGCVQAVHLITCSYTKADIAAAGVDATELKDNCTFTDAGIDCVYDLSTL
jgi:hypothetical protein